MSHITQEPSKEEFALGSFLSAMQESNLNGRAMRAAMLKALGMDGAAIAQPEPVSLTDEQILALNTGEVFFSESPSKYPECGHGTQYHAGAPGVVGFARAILAAAKRGDV